MLLTEEQLEMHLLDQFDRDYHMHLTRHKRRPNQKLVSLQVTSEKLKIVYYLVKF